MLSFIQTRLQEPLEGMWTSTLDAWAFSYTFGMLMVAEDALDSCDDEEAKEFFNTHTRRLTGGMDRITCTKRLGRVGYDEKLARQRDG